jgi:hypothetical protein
MAIYEVDRSKIKEILFRWGIKGRLTIKDKEFAYMHHNKWGEATEIKVSKYIPRIIPDHNQIRATEDIRALYPDCSIVFDYDTEWCLSHKEYVRTGAL